MAKFTFTDPDTNKRVTIEGDNKEGAIEAFEDYLSTKEPQSTQSPPPAPQVPQWEGSQVDPMAPTPPPSMNVGSMMGVGLGSDEYNRDISEDAASVGAFAYRNKGSLLGSVAGIPLGPPGMIAGGAVGRIYDVLEEQGLKGEDRDIGAALLEGAISVGIDITTLGLGRYVGRPVWAWAKGRLMAGDDAAAIVKELATRGRRAGEEVADVGSKQARAESQHIASQASKETDQSISLSRHQAGVGTPLSNVMESIGRIGVISKGVYETSRKRIVGVVSERMNKLVGDDALDAASIGSGLHGMYKEGIKAAGTLLNLRKETLKKELGQKTVSYKTITNAINNWTRLSRNKNTLGVTDISEVEHKAIAEISEYISAKSGPAGFLLDVDRKVKDVIGAALKEAKTDTAYRQLTLLQKRMKKAITVNLREATPKGGAQYLRLNRAYRKDITELKPEINQRFFEKTKEKGMQVIGEMFNTGGTAESIMAVHKTINAAYRLMSREAKSKLPFKTAIDARKAVASAYAETRLGGGLVPETIDPARFIKEAERLRGKTYAAKARAAMGKHYAGYKRTVNLLAHAMDDPSSGLFSLVIRGKEMGTAMKVVSTAAKGVAIAGSAIAAAGGVFVLPYVAARIAMNPNHVNKLIAISKMGPGSELKKTKMATVLLNDIGYRWDDDE